MTNYEKVLKSLSEVKTLSSHLTTLGKIKSSTEDTKLKNAIDDVIRLLQQEHARSKNKSTPIALDNTKFNEINVLIRECKKVVGTQKPEWQKLAEQHGWTPKT